MKEIGEDLKLGAVLRDTVTGFQGTATSKVEYLHGCVQFGLAPKVDKDGMIHDTVFFDWQRLEFVEDTGLEPDQIEGGPKRDAPGRTTC